MKATEHLNWQKPNDGNCKYFLHDVQTYTTASHRWVIRRAIIQYNATHTIESGDSTWKGIGLKAHQPKRPFQFCTHMPIISEPINTGTLGEEDGPSKSEADAYQVYGPSTWGRLRLLWQPTA